MGKTCLLLRFCDDSFSDSFITTVGVDFRFRSINVNGKMVKLQVWDTAGQERFRTITTAYYKGAHGIMLVYDITDRKTFEQISTVWLETVRQNSVNNGEMILIGNKCDIPESRQVTEEEAREFASLNNMPFFECSAKTGFNVDNAFCAIAENLTNREDLTNTRKVCHGLSVYFSQCYIVCFNVCFTLINPKTLCLSDPVIDCV